MSVSLTTPDVIFRPVPQLQPTDPEGILFCRGAVTGDATGGTATVRWDLPADRCYVIEDLTGGTSNSSADRAINFTIATGVLPDGSNPHVMGETLLGQALGGSNQLVRATARMHIIILPDKGVSPYLRVVTENLNGDVTYLYAAVKAFHRSILRDVSYSNLHLMNF